MNKLLIYTGSELQDIRIESRLASKLGIPVQCVPPIPSQSVPLKRLLKT